MMGYIKEHYKSSYINSQYKPTKDKCVLSFISQDDDAVLIIETLTKGITQDINIRSIKLTASKDQEQYKIVDNIICLEDWFKLVLISEDVKVFEKDLNKNIIVLKQAEKEKIKAYFLKDNQLSEFSLSLIQDDLKFLQFPKENEERKVIEYRNHEGIFGKVRSQCNFITPNKDKSKILDELNFTGSNKISTYNVNNSDLIKMLDSINADHNFLKKINKNSKQLSNDKRAFPLGYYPLLWAKEKLDLIGIKTVEEFDPFTLFGSRSTNPNKQLLKSVENSDCKGIRKALELGANINNIYFDLMRGNQTPLDYANAKSHKDVIKLLSTLGAKTASESFDDSLDQNNSNF